MEYDLDKLSIGIKLRKNIVLVDIDVENILYWILFKDDLINKKKFYYLV